MNPGKSNKIRNARISLTNSDADLIAMNDPLKLAKPPWNYLKLFAVR